MTDSEALELGREAVGCPGWRWVPGMQRLDGHRYLGDGEWARATPTGPQTGLHAPGQVPDLRDPCTAGGLLALVREAWGDPAAYCYRGGGCEQTGVWHVSIDLGTHRVARRGPTEVHALVSALRAAPRSTP